MQTILGILLAVIISLAVFGLVCAAISLLAALIRPFTATCRRWPPP